MRPGTGAVKRWWKSRRVRGLRRRLSILQVLLYPLAGLGMRLWCGLVRRGVHYDRRGPVFDYIREGRPCVIALWHQDVWPLMADLFHYTPHYPSLYMVSGGRVGVLGEYLAGVFGIDCVRGSSAGGGVEAVQELARRARGERRSVFIMADGSRGPAREARWGALYLARDAGLPILAVRAWGDNLVVLRKTWMHLAVPKPWGRTVLLSAEPLWIPPETDKAGLAPYRQELERRLNALCQAGEAYFRQGPAAADPWGPPVEPPRFP